jgi:hypothetical protein
MGCFFNVAFLLMGVTDCNRCEAFSQCGAASRAASSAQPLGSRSDACMVRGAHQEVVQGVAPGQPQSGSLIGCVAERAVHWDARSASFALHVGNLCTFATEHRSLGCPCAHAEIRTHACSVPRFAVVTRSRSERASRAFNSACVRFLRPQLVSYVQGWARAELGSTFEPCHVSGYSEHAKTHR